MIWAPKAGQRILLNYKNKAMPYQGKTGVVSICKLGRGGPVNALVRLDDGILVVVPRGQLNIAEENNDQSTIA